MYHRDTFVAALMARGRTEADYRDWWTHPHQDVVTIRTWNGRCYDVTGLELFKLWLGIEAFYRWLAGAGPRPRCGQLAPRPGPAISRRRVTR